MDGQHNASAMTVGDARRAQIVHAARELCLEKGFSKVTISDIASRVGMTRSLFYHYFQDKDQVADAVLDDVIDEVITHLEEWNANREVGNISKALDDVVRLTRSLIADEGPGQPAHDRRRQRGTVHQIHRPRGRSHCGIHLQFNRT